MTRLCSIEGCGRKHLALGWCEMHHGRWRRLGDPIAAVRKMAAPGETMAWIEANATYVGDDCLVWTFSRSKDGRACMSGGKPARVMCEAAHGAAPLGKHHAAHSCGKAHEGCINPRHLRWATPIENASDKEVHGTIIRGSDHPASKLNEDDVARVRALVGSMTQKEIARQYGVTTGCVSGIVRRKNWKHVA